MEERSLQDVLRLDIWAALQKASQGDDPEWKTAWVASQYQEGTPALRMMVLRDVDEDRRELVFFTDPRSPKWEQFAGNGGSVEVGFWAPGRKVQLRCTGLVRLHREDAVAAGFRSEVPSYSQQDYTALHPPGTPLPHWESGQASGADWHFGVVVIEITELDWLSLGREGHRRAKFHHQRLPESSWEMSWVQP